MNKPLELKKLSEIYSNYKYFFIDLWGVVHNGISLFEGVIETLGHLKLKKKKVFFLTNAPRRSLIIKKQLVNTFWLIDM